MNVQEYVAVNLNNETCTTDYGEPQVWVYLTSGRTIEVVHEMEGLKPKEWFYSLRLHCTEEEYENDTYHGTLGIIDQWTTSSGENAKPELFDLLQRMLMAYGEEWDRDSGDAIIQ